MDKFLFHTHSHLHILLVCEVIRNKINIYPQVMRAVFTICYMVISLILSLFIPDES
jgi:hypothetical protein